MAFMSGNLCHQIEHHLFPDLPSNRLSAVAVRVRELCDKYDLPYTSGPFLLQYGKAWRTIAKLSLPDKYLKYTADNAPETRSVKMFDELEPRERRGLKSAFAAVRERRRARRGANA
jgi:linoleoyl-CoA desaturase